MRRKTMFIISSVTMLACLHVPVAHSATYSCFGRAATKVGIPGPDTLNGTNCSDVIVGLDGNDNISGFDGNDRICGGFGADGIGGGGG